MSNVDPPAISTPSRPRYSLNPKRSGTFTAAAKTPNVAGFSPGGQVFEGYSYLSRSTSMSTSTRSRPKGLQSRTSDVAASPVAAAPRSLVASPSSPHISSAADPTAPSPLASVVELPQRSKSIHHTPSSISTPELHTISIHPPRSNSESERLAEAVANLPHNPKIWLPSQVALYLTHVLGLVPRPVVEDVTAYVRSSRMGGRAFLRLSEKDLERQGLNLKWRKLMIEAVRKLRRDALRGRIWGYDSGSLRWPKSAQDLQREEAEDDEGVPDDDRSTEVQDGVVHHSKTTSKLTLKRMRDSRKVRGMIQAFQTSPEKEQLPLSNLSIDSGYGQGYVRGQAQQILSEAEEKKLSLRRPLRPRRSTADFPWLENVFSTKHEDIEALLAGLTEQEAQELAKELGMSDLQDTEAVGRALQENQDDEFLDRREASGESADEVMLMPTLTRHSSADSISAEGDSSVSECSGTESEADFVESEGHTPRYGVLDEDVIRAILADEEASADEPSPATAQLTRSHTIASIVRPSRPYRASLYTDDELAALDNDVLHTRTESSRELVEAIMSSGQPVDDGTAEPDFGTARLRSADEKVPEAPVIPSFQADTSSTPREAQHEQASTIAPATEAENSAAASEEYIFTLPDPPSRRAGSIRRTAGRKATFGSKRGKAVLSLLNSDTEHSELFASLPGASMLRHTAAEDEEGWGGTLGRGSSRKSLNGVFDASNVAQPFRKRTLDRVASEAEGEVELPVEKYEETVLEGGMERKTSVEQRLSSLFHGEGDGGGESVETANVVPEEPDEVVVVDQAETVPTAAVEEGAEVVCEPVVEIASSTAEVDAVAEPGASPTAEAVAVPAEEAEAEVESDLLTAEASANDTADALAHTTATLSLDQDAEHAASVEADTTTTTPIEPSSAAADTEEPFELVPSPPPSSDPQLLVPLTVLEPHPSGTGSVKKRSMVLVDRKRFESLARRMTDLESQIDTTDRLPASGKSTVSGSGLRGMFDTASEEDDAEETLDEVLAASVAPPRETMQEFEIADDPTDAPASPRGWRNFLNPSAWAAYLSSLNPYYSTPTPAPAAEHDDELDLYALLGRPESDQERHLLSIGAIPAYMLGLGAGVGFVLVKEVLGGRH